MDDGFFRTSPSQVNKFLAEPAIWVLNRFHKTYSEMGARAWVGTAVTKALEAMTVHGWPLGAAQEWAFKVFDIEATRAIDENAPEERARIPALLAQAEALVIPFGKFKSFQPVFDGTIEGVPVSGRIDFEFETFDLKLKTTKALQKQENMSAEHLRKLAVYEALRQKPQAVCYVTEKKGAIYYPTREQLDGAMREVRGAIVAMKTAFDLGQDMAEKLYPPREYGSYLWDDKTLKKAHEIWR